MNEGAELSMIRMRVSHRCGTFVTVRGIERSSAVAKEIRIHLSEFAER